MTIQTPAPSTSPASFTTRSRRQLSAAVTLIAIGAGALALRSVETTPSAGSFIVLVLGLAFMAAHAVTRTYGLLVPAGILTGLGAGIAISQQLPGTEAVTTGVIVLGLGLGFLSIWVIGGVLRVAGHHWWPLVPGGILATIGAALLLGGQAVQVLDFWPVVLIGLGLLALWRARFGTRGHVADAAAHRS